MREAIVVVSDLHIGSYSGLCPPGGIRLDGGGTYKPNKFQRTLWRFWTHFWDEFVPQATKDATLRAIVINGDILEGIHHNHVGIVTTTWEHMRAGAKRILLPVREKVDRFHVIRGTEAHSAPGAEAEETLADSLKATINELGDHSSWQLWGTVDGVVFQFAHHIGVTSSAAYETSAPMRELISGFTEAAQWGRRLPDVFVRSHRHRFTEVPLPSLKGRVRLVVTPGWQLRTPHTERIDRMRMPHIGGVVFTVEDGICQVREKLYPLPEPALIQL